jgi:hypothetical protein
LYEKYKKNITSVTLFTTRNKPEDAGVFHYEMMGTQLHFQYNAIHIFDYSEAELLAMRSAVGIMLLAAQKSLLRMKVPDHSLNAERFMLVRALLECKQYNKDKLLSIIAFVKNIVYISNPEINHTFDVEIDSLNKNLRPMGILEAIANESLEKGIEKGIEKGKEIQNHAFVTRLITQLGLSDKEIAGIVEVSVAYVQQIREELKSK